MALLEARNLGKKFPIRSGFFKRVVDYEEAVREVDLEIREGEILGLVGESGCGKTTLARLFLRLLDPTEGRIRFAGERVDSISQRAFRPHRRNLQVVFQDPMESFDPRYRIRSSVEEGMKFLTDWSADRRHRRAVTVMKQVGLPPSMLDRYPHQLSGGQRQRVGIARALSLNPEVLICDEPTSALDVSIQAQIVNLLLDLKQEYGLTYLFISHDLNLVRFMSDRIAVMSSGRIVEKGEADRVYDSPRHSYTKNLLKSVLSRN